jgi:alanine-alpha-ketoisovalerate/valine-pyruvate aminotransferase
MNKLIEELNEFFRNEAKIILVDDNIEITVGSKTVILSLPEIVGGRNEPTEERTERESSPVSFGTS